MNRVAYEIVPGKPVLIPEALARNLNATGRGAYHRTVLPAVVLQRAVVTPSPAAEEAPKKRRGRPPKVKPEPNYDAGEDATDRAYNIPVGESDVLRSGDVYQVQFTRPTP